MYYSPRVLGVQNFIVVSVSKTSFPLLSSLARLSWNFVRSNISSIGPFVTLALRFDPYTLPMSTPTRFRVLHAFVSGRVQGVFFRDNTRRNARRWGLTGTVQNLGDGRVEVYAEGQEDQLQKLLEWLQHGPRYAQVDSVEENWLDDKRAFYDSFDVV